MYKPKDSFIDFALSKADAGTKGIKSYISAYEKYQLSNGMTVLLIESHKSPVVSVQTWVKTGSVDEQEGQEGITHFIEHLLFKETSRFKVGEIANLVEGAGGQLNAYTSFDRTVFYVTIASQYFQIAFEVLNQMIVFPKFNANSIDDERQVVIEEIKRSKDSPYNQSSDLLFSTLYPKHPYGHPILGYESHIKKFTPDQITAYYQNHYVPQNITLVISGDFKTSNIKHSIENYFGNFKKAQPLQKKTYSFQKAEKLSIQQASFQETHIHLAWRLSSFQDDLPALDVLSVIIGQGQSSRFYNKLRIQNLYVNSVNCYTYVLQDSGLFIVSCYLPEDKIDKTLKILTEEFLSLFTQSPTLEELQKAITLIESDQYYEMETVDGLSEKYGFYEILWSDPHYWKTYLRQVHSLRIEDLIYAAKTHLSPQRLSFCVMTQNPKEQKLQAKLDQWVQQYKNEIFPTLHTSKPQQSQLSQNMSFDHQTIAQSARSYQTKSTEKSCVEEVILPQGARMYLYQSSQTPTISLDLGFQPGGLISEPDALTGLSELVRRAWPGGTSQYTETLLKSKLDQLASCLNAFSGKNTLGLSLTTLSSSLQQSLVLLEDILKTPLFLEDVIKREKVAMQKQLIKRKDSPFKVAIQSFIEVLFKGHPYARDPLGIDNSLSLIQREDVISYWRKVIDPKQMVICAVGDFNPEQIKETFAKLIESHYFRQSLDIPNPLLKPLTQEQKVFCHTKDKAQSSIILGYRGLTLKGKNRFALEVLEAVLSGQGGRLFLELRDKASLAYTVAPFSFTGHNGGLFAIYIGCSPEKGRLAIDMIRAEIQKLCEHLISEEEVQRAKKYLIGHYNISLQKNSSLSSAIFFREIYKISYKEVFNYAKHIDLVTCQQLFDLSQELFSQPEILVAHGPLRPWD